MNLSVFEYNATSISSEQVEVIANSYISSNEENLNLKNNILLNPLLTLQSYGIKDGEEIFLI